MPQNQDQPNTGQGQGQQQAGTSELEVQMAQLQRELENAKNEAKKHQSQRDQLQTRVDRLTLKRTSQTPQQRAAARTTPAQQQQQPNVNEELAEFANEQARDAMLYREVIQRGLTLDDVEGIEFDTPSELKTQLTLIQQQKELEALRTQYDQAVAERQAANQPGAGGTGGTSGDQGVRIDTGGVSSTEAQQQLQGDLDALRAKALELKKQGRYQEASWVALKAAHMDPKNALKVTPRDLQQ